jgi:Arc/MetJ-type ribon-helix-helix transcriptional regulator
MVYHNGLDEMARKKKAVFTAESEQLDAIDAVVRSGRYPSTSAFLREAIREKLARLRRERLEQQVGDYCSEEDVHDGPELISSQAIGDEP